MLLDVYGSSKRMEGIPRSYLINRFSLEWTFTPGAKRLISRGFGMLGLKPRPPKTIYEIGSSICEELQGPQKAEGVQ